MRELDECTSVAQQPAEGRSVAPARDELTLFSFGPEAQGWRRSFREVVLWSLILVCGSRPFLTEETDHFDPVPQRGNPTAPLDPLAGVSADESHDNSGVQRHDQSADNRHDTEYRYERTTLPGYEGASKTIVDRYEPIFVKDVSDRIALELMLLTEPQIEAMLRSYPAERYPNEGARIRLLCQSAVDNGYAQADVAECALHTYFYVKARALCTDMLEVQLSGVQPYLSDRAAPDAVVLREASDDPIRDALELLTSMSESILLQANRHGVGAQDAAARTHPGTVMARDLALMLSDPQSIGARTRGDLESMASVTLATYTEVTKDTHAASVFVERLERALNAVLARRAEIVAERLYGDEADLVHNARESNILVRFDIDGDGQVTRSELTPLGKRYNAELVEALTRIPVPTRSSASAHEGQH